MTAIAFIGLAVIGTLIRFVAGRANVPALPWGTLAVNIVGSFLLGWATAAGFSELTLFGAGLLGSMTTFSTLAHETVEFHESNRTGRAVTYLAITLVAGLAAAALGYSLT